MGSNVADVADGEMTHQNSLFGDNEDWSDSEPRQAHRKHSRPRKRPEPAPRTRRYSVSGGHGDMPTPSPYGYMPTMGYMPSPQAGGQLSTRFGYDPHAYVPPNRDVPPPTKNVSSSAQANPFMPQGNSSHPPPPPPSAGNPFAASPAPGYQQPLPGYAPQSGWDGSYAPYPSYAPPQRPQTTAYFQQSPFAPPSPYSQQPTYQDVAPSYYPEYPEPPGSRSEPPYEPAMPRPPIRRRSVQPKTKPPSQRIDSETKRRLDELERRDRERETEEATRKAQEDEARKLDILAEKIGRRLHVSQPSSMRREYAPQEPEIQSEPDRTPSARPGFDYRRYSTPARSVYHDEAPSWSGATAGYKDAAQREMDDMWEAKAREEQQLRRSPSRRPPPSRQGDSYRDRVESDRRSVYSSSRTDAESLQRAFAAGMEIALRSMGGSHVSGSQHPASHHPGFDTYGGNADSQFREGFEQYAPPGRSSNPPPPMTEKDLLGRPTRRGTRPVRQGREPDHAAAEDPAPRRQPPVTMSGANVGVARPPVEPRSKTHPGTGGGRGPTYQEAGRHYEARVPALRPDPAEYQAAWSQQAVEEDDGAWSDAESNGSQTYPKREPSYPSVRPGNHNLRESFMPPVAPTPPGRRH
ncbi:hypothetical protein CSOJ01_05014 [Colletotrichum sojae]|uniref:Uncharacterized protein n=1 Tax=Colletotrichum sojae TaxID=2175907 RepID=A0A8H6MYA7_9PEZI|nr:hypothetical protein CSOJ01_05014 [Colletotrichum sojae]